MKRKPRAAGGVPAQPQVLHNCCTPLVTRDTPPPPSNEPAFCPQEAWCCCGGRGE